MKNKGNSLIKRLLVILGILIVVVVSLGLWLYFSGKMPTNQWIPTKLKNETPIVVSELKDDKEKALGTVIYSAAKIISDVHQIDRFNTITLQSPDSLNGVINIYSQDLLNRYPKYSVTKQEISKEGALNEKMIRLTCSGPNGKIVIDAWAIKNGLTSIYIMKDNSF